MISVYLNLGNLIEEEGGGALETRLSVRSSVLKNYFFKRIFMPDC